MEDDALSTATTRPKVCEYHLRIMEKVRTSSDHLSEIRPSAGEVYGSRTHPSRETSL